MANRVLSNYVRWLLSEKLNDEEREELRSMDDKKKDDAFFQDIEFGTAGMRGVLGPGTNRLNRFTVKKASIAFSMYINETFKDVEKKAVAIAYDNRWFSPEFCNLSAEILNDYGIDAYIFDSLRPTPELSYAVRELNCVGGIMITASHNSKEYNGYKIYDETGCQLVPTKIERVIEILADLPDELTVEPDPVEVRGVTHIIPASLDDTYVAAVETLQINPKLNKKGFKIVYTPQHGTSYENAMRVFNELGYEVIPVAAQCEHDPNFGATLSPNPETAEAFIEPIKLAEEEKADLIVMTDPDGDRCGLAYHTKEGEWVRLTGNESAALLIDYIMSNKAAKKKLPKNGALYDTVVTSDLGRKIAKSYGVNVESFLTGFKYIGHQIDHYEKIGGGPEFVFGYEESYGCLVGPFVRDKDGIQAITLYCEMALFHHLKGKNLGQAFDELQKKHGWHKATTKSFMFPGSDGKDKMNKIIDFVRNNPPAALAGSQVIEFYDFLTDEKLDCRTGEKTHLDLDSSNVLKFVFDDSSWLAIRPSGTEPKCKVYVEGVSPVSNEEATAKALALIKEFCDFAGME